MDGILERGCLIEQSVGTREWKMALLRFTSTIVRRTVSYPTSPNSFITIQTF